MAKRPADAKNRALKEHGCLNPHAETVRDELFVSNAFFDPRDLLQVKYEMLRALDEAQCELERRRAEPGQGLDERQRKRILALASDFPRLWNDPATPHRERKRMARLLIEDVTLRSSRSPCSPVAASVHLPGVPEPDSRTKSERPRAPSRSPATQ